MIWSSTSWGRWAQAQLPPAPTQAGADRGDTGVEDGNGGDVRVGSGHPREGSMSGPGDEHDERELDAGDRLRSRIDSRTGKLWWLRQC